ncbi:ORF6N domain-containing protein [Arenimonas sp.]|nr:ORF6N domain-containing protein [Candidatus Parcubacteria bacterium]
MNIGLIREKIYIIRGKKVMFDKDLAMLYEVPTKRLNEAVKRNIKRFPEDFMFQLNKKESELFSDSGSLRSQIATLKNKSLINKGENDNLRSQIATSSWGGQSYNPYVFTEQGIAMLSSVLKSDKAISVNIQIIRIFTKLREMIDTYKELREKIEEMERNNNMNFNEIYKFIRLLMKEEGKPKNPIGFIV